MTHLYLILNRIAI